MEINKYGVDIEKLNSQLQDVPNLAPNHNLNPRFQKLWKYAKGSS